MLSSPARPSLPLLVSLAGLTVGGLTVAPVSAEAQFRVSEPLQEAYFAWDEGRYIDAAEKYLQLLRGEDGAQFTDEVARLTGELHPVREVDDDGQGLAVSSDGRFLQWRRQVDGEWMSFVEPVEGGHRAGFRTQVGALSGDGRFAWIEGGWAESDPAPQLRIERLDGVDEPQREASVELAGIRPMSLHFAPDEAVLYLTGGRDGEGDRLRIFRLRAPEWMPEALGLAEGHASEPQPVTGGRYLAFTRPAESPLPEAEGMAPSTTPDPGLGLLELATGRVHTFPGHSLTVSPGGQMMAWIEEGEGNPARIRALPLPVGGLDAEPRPHTLIETEDRLASPALSPDGDRVAYQTMPHTDWEIFMVSTADPAVREDTGPERVTREIQHDLFPAWISDTQLLAMKGEFRHRRSYLHDLETGAGYRLFHNNTFRTIAPEYEWVVDPLGRGLLLVAERDGDTIAPERAVFWVDLTRTVELPDLLARLEEALDHERALLERGRERFAPGAEEIRAAADAVSVGRIYHYAEILYSFGSKFATEPGNQLAIDYLVETLEEWGYEPELQWFEATGRGGGARTANVVATLRGTENPEQIYVISSHFDSVLRSPGADDNSSGTTALLEAARVLAGSPRRATIQFAFLTAEEAGLLGAREFVRRAQAQEDQIAGVLNNDMIGWTRSHRLDNTIRYSNDGIRDLQHAAAHLFSDLITYDARYYRGTDAAVFFDAYGDIVGGIGSYPVLHNPNYHQPTDDLWTIDQRLVAEVSRTTVATIMHLADGLSRIEGLRMTEEAGSDEPVFTWIPAPEPQVSGYRVRAQDGHGRWHDLAEVTEPRFRMDPEWAEQAQAVGIRAFTADGRESFDDRRLPRTEW